MRSSTYFKAFVILIVSCLCVWLTFALISTLFGTSVVSDILINQQIMKVPVVNYYHSPHSINGVDEMRRSTVSIIGVGRNVAHKLNQFLPKIVELANQFLHSQTIFVIGDTTDNSLTELQQWAAESNGTRSVFAIDCLDKLDTFPGFTAFKLPREGRIALARNLALNELRKRPPTDYVIIVDMDIVGWDPIGVQDSFGRRAVWDVACAHGILLHGIYRDTYALRALDLNNNHHLSGEDHELYNISESQWRTNRAKLKLDKKLSLEFMDLDSIRRRQQLEEAQLGDRSRGDSSPEFSPQSTFLRDRRPLRPIRVDSCFGGLAIYKYEAISGCNYEYRQPVSPYMLDCEHVLFNRCLAEQNNARIVSNPNMKLWYGHSNLGDVNLQKEVYKLILGEKRR